MRSLLQDHSEILAWQVFTSFVSSLTPEQFKRFLTFWFGAATFDIDFSKSTQLVVAFDAGCTLPVMQAAEIATDYHEVLVNAAREQHQMLRVVGRFQREQVVHCDSYSYQATATLPNNQLCIPITGDAQQMVASLHHFMSASTCLNP